MKNIIFHTTVLLSILLITACDNLPDEQFDKYVIMTRNGFQERSFEYNSDAVISTDISVSVSGTAVIDQDVDVNVKIDQDALYTYNFDKFRGDETLYYTLLPEESYELTSKTVAVKAGDEYGLLPVKINLAKLNKLKNYVLPVTIESVSKFKVGDPKYTTILMSVVLKNGFSGSYAVNANMIDHITTGKKDFTFTGTRNLFTVDEKTCYLYAGNVSEQDLNRDKYRIEVKINPDSTLTLTAQDPSVQLIPATPNKANRINVITKKSEVIDSRLEVTTNIYIKYVYKDLNNPAYPENFTFDATPIPPNEFSFYKKEVIKGIH